MKPVFAILVTYRRFEYFKQTIESLIPTLPDGSHLLIIDNHSDQMQYETWWKEVFETHPYNNFGNKITLQVFFMDKNEGWGAAMNEAFHVWPQWKEYEYILESNNDVTYEPDWCIKAQLMMEAHKEIG